MQRSNRHAKGHATNCHNDLQLRALSKPRKRKGHAKGHAKGTQRAQRRTTKQLNKRLLCACERSERRDSRQGSSKQGLPRILCSLSQEEVQEGRGEGLPPSNQRGRDARAHNGRSVTV